jgi:hypothetical protein
LERPATLAFGSARVGGTDTAEKGDSDMTTAKPTPSHLSLACRTADVAQFLPLGLEVYRTRGGVTDLVDPHNVPSDTREQRRAIALAGIPFYGCATLGSPLHPAELLPVVFAAHAGAYQEAHCHPDLKPLARLSSDGFPDVSDLIVARAYLRCLAAALTALPDPAPWLDTLNPYKTLACAGCGGRGWHMCREEDLTFVVACQMCREYQDDVLAGMSAYGDIERGWPE